MTNTIKTDSDSLTVTTIANKTKALMMRAIENGCSDLHLSSITGFHARLHGDLVQPDNAETFLEEDWTHSLFIKVLKTLAASESLDKQAEGMNAASFAVLDTASWPTELDVVIRLGTLGVWRLNLCQSDLSGFSSAMRLLPETIPNIDDLLPPSLHFCLASIKKLATKRSGLVLVSGATGSGKSSTLAALINLINNHYSRMIVTLEDPVEFRRTSNQSIIRHRQVGIDTPSFSQGLKSALRQDPDVILIGELRDAETLSLALTAAETGHLVLATVHARDAESTLTRIVESFEASRQALVRHQLASSLVGIISQRLIMHKDGKGRSLVPEIVIFPSNEEYPATRNVIREGRFQELESTLNGTKQIENSFYLSKKAAYTLVNHSKPLAW